MKTDFYFTTELTEEEHWIVENMIQKECIKRGYELMYYRQLKTGHVPLIRECKINVEPSKGEQMLTDLGIKYGNYNRKPN